MAEKTHLGAFSKYGCILLSSQPEGRVQGWPLGIYDKESERWKWQPTPVLLPGKSHGRRSLVGYSPWGHKESDRTERLYLLSSILESLPQIEASILLTTSQRAEPPLTALLNPGDSGAWRLARPPWQAPHCPHSALL